MWYLVPDCDIVGVPGFAFQSASISLRSGSCHLGIMGMSRGLSDAYIGQEVAGDSTECSKKGWLCMHHLGAATPAARC